MFIESGNTDGWIASDTAFGEPVELEVDFDGVGDPKLEIELTLPGRPDERAPSVECSTVADRVSR